MTILLGFMLVTAFAQAPQAFSFQAVVRDSDGGLLNEKNVTVTLSVLNGTPSGKVVYSETFQAKTDAAGVLSLAIGKGDPAVGRFSNIDWKSGAFYVKTTVRLPGDAKDYDMGALQLLSVPYALYANEAGNSDGGSGAWQLPAGNITSITQNYYIQKPISVISEKNELVAITPIPDDPEAGTVAVSADGKLKVWISSMAYSGGRSGIVWLTDQNEEPKISLMGDKDNAVIYVSSDDGTETYLSSSQLSAYNADEELAYRLFTADNGEGILQLYDERSPTHSVSLGSGESGENGGYLYLYGTNGSFNVLAGSTFENVNSGGVWTRNGNGGDLIRMSSLEGYPSNGGLGIYDATGEKGKFYVNSNGKSRLIVDEIYNNSGYSLYSATADYSLLTRSDGGADPCYVTETGDNQLIVRGTATLQNGSYTVTLPPEAASKIRANTLTVQLTPLSATSKGLAITDRQAGSFTVSELMSGNGSYAFDWTLTALLRDDPELRNQLHEMEVAGPAADKPAGPSKSKKAPALRALKQMLPNGGK
jgi:hypothetical protein